MFHVDIFNKATGKLVTTTNVRGVETLAAAVQHVAQTHPKHLVKASEKQPSETQAAIDAAEPAKPE